LQTASDVPHIVFVAEIMKKIDEANAKNPKFGFLYAGRNVAAPAAAAPAAEPSVESDESEKKKKPKVSREKGPFSTDATARITRLRLSISTGDRAVDTAIENEVLNGLVLNEPPPDDMPMPINLRISARKAN
jgi:hypothetical protein